MGIWGEAAGALIVPTPTLPRKYPTPMSPQIQYKYNTNAIANTNTKQKGRDFSRLPHCTQIPHTYVPTNPTSHAFHKSHPIFQTNTLHFFCTMKPSVTRR